MLSQRLHGVHMSEIYEKITFDDQERLHNCRLEALSLRDPKPLCLIR